jgi:hypothetical protein
MLDSGIDQVGIARLAGGGEDERGVGGGVLDQILISTIFHPRRRGIALPVACRHRWLDIRNESHQHPSFHPQTQETKNLLSKSPESETTTVPDCLSQSREVVIVVCAEVVVKV